MFHSTRRTMKWTALLKDIKDKVGLTPILSDDDSSASPSSYSRYLDSAEGGGVSAAASPSQFDGSSPDSSYERGKYNLELDFKRFWEEFRSSNFEKEKEVSLNMAIDIFCRLVKQKADVVCLVNTLVETHIFSFVIGRAFVTDIEKLRIHSKGKSLHIANVLDFFSDLTEDGIHPGSNLLCAVEALVSAPIDKQPLLDSGILSCLIYLLNVFLNPGNTDQGKFPNAVNLRENISTKKDEHTMKLKRLEVEGSIVHIMKALASHSSAALCLIENDSLQLLFRMVTTGSLSVFSRFKYGHISLHTIQLHRHAMQILSLLLVNDNGNTAKYIQKHHLIKYLIMAVKDFNSDDGDPAYTMGIVDLLMECVLLSYRPAKRQIWAIPRRPLFIFYDVEGYQPIMGKKKKAETRKAGYKAQIKLTPALPKVDQSINRGVLQETAAKDLVKMSWAG